MEHRSYPANPVEIGYLPVYTNKKFVGRLVIVVWKSHTLGRPDGNWYFQIVYQNEDARGICYDQVAFKSQEVKEGGFWSAYKRYRREIIELTENRDKLNKALNEAEGYEL